VASHADSAICANGGGTGSRGAGGFWSRRLGDGGWQMEGAAFLSDSFERWCNSAAPLAYEYELFIRFQVTDERAPPLGRSSTGSCITPKSSPLPARVIVSRRRPWRARITRSSGSQTSLRPPGPRADGSQLGPGSLYLAAYGYGKRSIFSANRPYLTHGKALVIMNNLRLSCLSELSSRYDSVLC
jgi:hypothetical protein